MFCEIPFAPLLYLIFSTCKYYSVTHKKEAVVFSWKQVPSSGRVLVTSDGNWAGERQVNWHSVCSAIHIGRKKVWEVPTSTTSTTWTLTSSRKWMDPYTWNMLDTHYKLIWFNRLLICLLNNEVYVCESNQQMSLKQTKYRHSLTIYVYIYLYIYLYMY